MGNMFQWSRYTDQFPVTLFPPCVLSERFHPQCTCSFQGTFAGIIIGLTQLNCSELKLRRLCYRQGYVLSASSPFIILLIIILVFYFSQCSHDSHLFPVINILPSCRLLGVDKLFSYAINEWLNDIKKNQLPGILGGVGPIHSLVQLGKLDCCFYPRASDSKN